MPPKKRKLDETRVPLPAAEQFFAETAVFIVNAGIEKMRQQIFRTQVNKYGGKVCEELDDNVDLIIVDDKMESERLCRILKWEETPQNIPVIKSAWLSLCLKQKQNLLFDDFKLEINSPRISENTCKTDEPVKEKSGEDNSVVEKPTKVAFTFHSNKRPRLDPDSEDSDYKPSDEEVEATSSDVTTDTSVTNQKLSVSSTCILCSISLYSKKCCTEAQGLVTIIYNE